VELTTPKTRNLSSILRFLLTSRDISSLTCDDARSCSSSLISTPTWKKKTKRHCQQSRGSDSFDELEIKWECGGGIKNKRRRKNLQPLFTTHMFNLVIINSLILKGTSILYRFSYQLRAVRFEGRIAEGATDFLLPRIVHTQSGVHADNFSLGTGSIFRR
jgi:hypothetical protein